MQAQITAHQFTFKALTATADIQLANFQGKVVLLVNTASACGLTKQYQGLEDLYQTYQERGLVVLGIPSNDFAGQEPGSHSNIATFCQRNYGVSFPLTTKYAVIGEQAHPFYQWAKTQLGFGSRPKWNFHKYLINGQGQLVDYFLSTTSPQAKRVHQAIEKHLALL